MHNTPKTLTNWLDTVRLMLGCKCLITVDTACSWIASAYSFPTIGLYGSEYYIRNGNNYISSIQPINPNATYLDANNVNDIPIELIVKNIKKML
jgi:ADP-heptose:LPS heptosyltransferase